MQRPKLIIIEENQAFRQMLGKCQGLRNWIVLGVDDWKSAKALLSENNIRVALVGLDSLGRKGIEIIRMIGEISIHTRVITLNSPEQLSLSIEGMKLGAFDDFLIPVDTDALAKRINEAAMIIEPDIQ